MSLCVKHVDMLLYISVIKNLICLCCTETVLLCNNILSRSSRAEVFFGKVVLKICSRFTGEHPCRSGISIKLLFNFIEIVLRHGCSPVNLLHHFITPLPKSPSARLLLDCRKDPLIHR